MPLLNLCGVTGNKKTIQTALCFLSGEKKEDYEWAMTQFKELLEKHDIPWPLSIVTDRELALMNALEKVFPDVVHILCTWHVNMNILANCRKHFPKDLKDPEQTSPQGYITDPKWESFLKDWSALLNASTEEEYEAQLKSFRKHPQKAVDYVESTWLIWKEKLIRYWVDMNPHFGIRVTSPLEGCHATLKAYLKVSTSDLKGVFDRLLPFWRQQHKAIMHTIAYEQNLTKH